MPTEGHIPYAGGETWYRIVGDGEEPGKLPLLCLHGGPGAPHDYLEPLEQLATTGRRVVFYDQIGCGRSWVEKPADFWTVELFVAEVQAVRDALGLDRTHLFGSSWGGMLAMEYALTQPAGLASLVLSSSPASIPLWEEETGRLRRELPDEAQARPRRARGGRHARLARVRGGVDGVLQTPRLPGRPVPGLRPAHLRRRSPSTPTST